MAIVNPIPTPPVLTTAQAQARVAFQVKNQSQNVFNQIARTYNILYALIWKNPNGLTPQQAFDAVGTDSVSLCLLSESLATVLNSAVANTVATTTPKTLTHNADGTVTVGA